MGKLLETWPKAEFVITGVLGPASNAHGPNEWITVEQFKNSLKFPIALVKEYCL